MTEFCPECLKKDLELKESRRDHEAALKEAGATAEKLKGELAEAQKPRPAAPQEIPDLDTVIRHCTDGSCPAHAAALEKYRQSVAADVKINLAKPENKSHLLDVMKAAKVVEMPDRIIIKNIPGGH